MVRVDIGRGSYARINGVVRELLKKAGREFEADP